MSTTRLRYCIIILRDVTIRRNHAKDTQDLSVLLLTTAWEYTLKSSLLESGGWGVEVHIYFLIVLLVGSFPSNSLDIK